MIAYIQENNLEDGVSKRRHLKLDPVLANLIGNDAVKSNQKEIRKDEIFKNII